MNWKEFEGKLLHINVETVYPYGSKEDQVTVKVHETGEYVQFEVSVKED